MITFLHTSKTHINRFEKLVKRLNNKIKTKHFVNESLLQSSLKSGKLDKENFEKEILKIKKENPAIIICTCSTYGKLCENFENVKRIDQPIAEYLVSKYLNIGIAFTAISTKKVSKELIQSFAKKQNRAIKIVEIDCTSSWQYFEKGAEDEYEKSIARQIEKYEQEVDAIFLAQASMEGAKEYLQKEEVYSSPEFGLKVFLEKLKLKE